MRRNNYNDEQARRAAQANDQRRSKTIEALTAIQAESPIGRFKRRTPDYTSDALFAGGLYLTGMTLYEWFIREYPIAVSVFFLIMGIASIAASCFVSNKKAQVDGEYIFIKDKKYIAGQLDKLHADSSYVYLYCAHKCVFKAAMSDHHCDSLVKWARTNNIPVEYYPDKKPKMNVPVLLGTISVVITAIVVSVMMYRG